MVSRWITIDLHMHSYYSNKIKSGDWKGKSIDLENYLEELKTKLDKDNISIFSITDHNIINIELYEKIFNDENFPANPIIGIEVDIHDQRIQDKKFHCLFLFDKDQFANVKTLNDSFSASRDQKEIKGQKIGEMTWKFSEVYEMLYDSRITEFFAIPHYNNKSTGVKGKKVSKMHTPFAVFSAFEDGNNPAKIVESIKVYLQNSVANFPTVAFSDWHGGEDKTSTRILGNPDFAFESLRLAFSDPQMRISFISDSSQENVRDCNERNDFVEKIVVNGQEILLSPYQNTIIGGFGTGKSLLKELMKEGKSHIQKNSEYKNIISSDDSLMMFTKKGNTITKFKENSDINLVIFNQNNALFYTRVINEEIKENLERDLKLKFPNLEKEFNFNSNLQEKLCELLNEHGVISEGEIINYSAINTIDNIAESRFDISDVKSYSEFLDNNSCIIKEKIDEILSKKFMYDFNLLTDEENKNLISIKNKIDVILDNANKRTLKIKNKILELNEKNKKYVDKINEESDGLSGQLKKIENAKINFQNFVNSVEGLKQSCYAYEKLVDKNAYDNTKEMLETRNDEHFPELMLQVRYLYENDYMSYENYLFRAEYRNLGIANGLFKMIYEEKTELHNNKTNSPKKINKNVDEILNTYFKNYFKDNFKEKRYDIIIGDKSIMNFSAGGRAQEIINILFSRIDSVLGDNNKINILLIDQPEDNLDNKNIQQKFVEKIRETKKNNKNIQCIIITHNSNIAIGTDSENIIIANGKLGSEKFEFDYQYGGLENKAHRSQICRILEGGEVALKNRGIKYGIDFKRKELE